MYDICYCSFVFLFFFFFFFFFKQKTAYEMRISDWSSDVCSSDLCKGTLIPKEIRDKEVIHRFMEAIAQFERIVNDSGFIKLQRLTEDEIIGTDGKQGLLEQYLTLSREVGTPMQDIALGGEEIRKIGRASCRERV